jgi:integrase
LRWPEIDLERGLIRRIPNKTARRNPKPVIVPIHPVLHKILSETPATERSEYVLPEIAALYNRRTDLVTDMVQAHFKKCGIRLHRPGTGENGNRAIIEVGFHSLRHTFVSLCHDGDAPVAVVQSLVGHSNPAMTRHYTHVGELAAGRAVALLPSVMSEAAPIPAKREQAEILREIQAIAKTITAKNWREKKAALLATLSQMAATVN